MIVARKETVNTWEVERNGETITIRVTECGRVVVFTINKTVGFVNFNHFRTHNPDLAEVINV